METKACSGAEFVVCGADTRWDSASNLCKTDPSVLNDAAHNQRLKLAAQCRAWCYTLNQKKISDCKLVCNHLNNDDIHTDDNCMSKSSANLVQEFSSDWPDNLVESCGLSENDLQNCCFLSDVSYRKSTNGREMTSF